MDHCQALYGPRSGSVPPRCEISSRTKNSVRKVLFNLTLLQRRQALQIIQIVQVFRQKPNRVEALPVERDGVVTMLQKTPQVGETFLRGRAKELFRVVDKRTVQGEEAAPREHADQRQTAIIQEPRVHFHTDNSGALRGQ